MRYVVLCLGVFASPLAAQSLLNEQAGGATGVPESAQVLEPAATAPLLGSAAGGPVIEMAAPEAGPMLNGAGDGAGADPTELLPEVLSAPDADAAPLIRPAPRPTPGTTEPRGHAPEAGSDPIEAGIDTPEAAGDPAGAAVPGAVAAAVRRVEPDPVAALAGPESEPLPGAVEAGISAPRAGPDAAAPRVDAVPQLTAQVPVMEPVAPSAPMAAVLLPAMPERETRIPARAAGLAVQPSDQAPVLSRPRPQAPGAVEAVRAPQTHRAAPLAAVLMPGTMDRPAQRSHARASALVAAPGMDRFPASALPPGSLPEGPESLARAVAPPWPRPEAMAAVLLREGPAQRLDAPSLRPAPPALPALPRAGTPPMDPEAPIRLPDPHPQALARMIEDASICWQMASLGPDARWAEIAVEVALDDTNMPAAASIRLTGFRGGLSQTAAEAYRAAHAALRGCAEATGALPATEAATLLFDRTGIRLR